MKIALFGGSFDPIHLGHVAVVEEALATLDIDKIIVMPAFLNPFKDSSHASAQKRLEWTQRVFSTRENVLVSDFEIQQQKPVRTIETVLHLYKIYNIDTLYIIIGADNIENLSTWYKYEEIVQKAQFVVASRGNYEIPKKYLSLDVRVDTSSSALRQKIRKNYIPVEIAKDISKYYTDKK